MFDSFHNREQGDFLCCSFFLIFMISDEPMLFKLLFDLYPYLPDTYLYCARW